MVVNYIGGIAEINGRDPVVRRRLLRFLETANIIETDEYIIDVDNIFKRKFMCCKENCDFYIHHKEKNKLFGAESIDWVDKSCCYDGSLEIPDSLILKIDEHLDGILNFTDKECKEHIVKNGWKHKISKKLTGIGALPKDGRCLFTTVDKEGMPLCALHSYALSIGADILEFKPYECFMYPLDFIQIDEKILITSIDNHGSTQGFIRWGDTHLAQGCQYKTEHGLPMYEYAKDIICLTLGKKVYNDLDKLYKEHKWE